MAAINKTPAGKWRVQVRRAGLYASKTFHKKCDADTWARETELQIDRGGSVIKSGPKTLKVFADLIDRHIADMHEVGKPLRRSKAYSLNLLKEKLGRIRIGNLNRQRVIEFGRSRALEGAGPCTVGADVS